MTSKTSPKIPFQVEMIFTHGIAREIWPSVRRIVAPNSGPYTQNGTNTYILGRGNVAIIDPGPDDATHLRAILDELSNEVITHILLTHTHKDHSSLIPALKQKTGAKVCAVSTVTENRGSRKQAGGPLEDSFVDKDFTPDHHLNDGEIIEAETWGVRAIHTPGHAPDHLCFAHTIEPILFTGDHVMAWNTSVIIPPEGRMADYMQSLKKILGGNYQRLMPGHGGQARDPERLVKAYLMHRRWRETAILEHIQKGKSTIEELLPLMYPDAKPEIRGAASLSILAHAEHLREQGKIEISKLPVGLDVSFKST